MRETILLHTFRYLRALYTFPSPLASSTLPPSYVLQNVWCSLVAFNTHQQLTIQLESGCDNGSSLRALTVLVNGGKE